MKEIKPKDLDLSMVKLAQENYTKQKNTELERQFTDEEEELSRNFIESSVGDPKNRYKQQINGKLYVGKSDPEKIKSCTAKALIAAGVIVSMVTIFKGIGAYATLDLYDHVMEQKQEESLTQENINAYKYDHNVFTDSFNDYNKITEAEKELKATGDYNVAGDYIGEEKREYLPVIGDDVFSISELTQDAIDKASDEVIDEYKNIRRW